MIRNRTGGLGALLLTVTLLAASAAAEKKFLGEGEGFFRSLDLKDLPRTELGFELSPPERTYLGLGPEESFTLEKVGADVLLVEFLNVFCYACIMQAPIMNDVHTAVEASEDLRERVRFLGIAVGNSRTQVESFKKTYDITYPIIADPDFKALDAMGNPGGTPFLLLLTPSAGETGRAHMGLMRDPERMVAEMASLLTGAPAAGERGGEMHLGSWRNLQPDLTPEELQARLKSSAAEIGLTATAAEKVPLAGGEVFYRLEGGGRGLWAKVAGRARVCNICHDIFFILLFDDSGRIVNFTPLRVTKYENELFSDEDTAFMKQRVIGRFVTEKIEFDAEVDAVSTATMSSELIFDTIRRLKTSYLALKKP